MLNLIDTRNRHFLAAARRVLAALPAHRPINLADVAREAAMMPAPHYYCTYDYALRVLRVLRHGRLTLRTDRRLEMFTEINDKCQRYMDRHACRLPEALGYVLSGESASRFFISPSTALRLLREN